MIGADDARGKSSELGSEKWKNGGIYESCRRAGFLDGGGGPAGLRLRVFFVGLSFPSPSSSASSPSSMMLSARFLDLAPPRTEEPADDSLVFDCAFSFSLSRWAFALAAAEDSRASSSCCRLEKARAVTDCVGSAVLRVVRGATIDGGADAFRAAALGRSAFNARPELCGSFPGIGSACGGADAGMKTQGQFEIL